MKTNPLVHKVEDAKVKLALSEGKGYNKDGTVDAIIDNQLNGKGAQELGEAALIGVPNEITGAFELHEQPEYEM